MRTKLVMGVALTAFAVGGSLWWSQLDSSVHAADPTTTNPETDPFGLLAGARPAPHSLKGVT